MNAINFVIRTRAGTVEHGSVGGPAENFLVDAGSGNDISLNLNQGDLRGYDRAANDLLITLADGRVIVLEGYFDGVGTDAANRLFLSTNGALNEVSFIEAEAGALFAQYGPTQTWDKWSPSDALIFVEEPTVVANLPYEDEEVSMIAPALLGLGGLGASGLGAAAAGLGGLALLSGLGGDGSGSGSGSGSDGTEWIPPTVDDVDRTREVGGDDDLEVIITGTGNPGSEVVVTIGGQTVTTIVNDDRTWEASFGGDTFPNDGLYDNVGVVVTEPGGQVSTLIGPVVAIDTIPPVLELGEGFVSLGDVFNEVNHSDGVELAGTTEPGATLTITIGDITHPVDVGDDGVWTFTFDDTVFPPGEYVTNVVITATDPFGNATVISDSVQIDTVNELTLDNTPLTGDDVVSDAENGAGVTLSGTSQAGAAISVTVAGVTQTTVTGSDGSWTVTLPAGGLPGGTYDTQAVIVSTDPAGNVVTVTHNFAVDTETSVTFNAGAVGGDGVVSAAEGADGVVLTGKAEAGATVVVEANGAVYTVIAGADGVWTANMPSADLPGGETDMVVTVTSTDVAGNTATTTGTVVIDMITSVTIDANIAGDGVVNAAEAAAGITVTGTAEAGATVVVSANGHEYTVTATAAGTWSVNMPTANLPTGETALDITATATDPAGNTATTTGSVLVDTVTSVTMEVSGAGADDVVNADEAALGLTLTGTAEAGATVVVTANGHSYTVTATDAGTWSVDMPAADLPSGETTMDVTATATDAAGNTASATSSVAIDTETSVTLDVTGAGADGIVNAAEAAAGVTLSGTSEAGATVVVIANGHSYTVTATDAGTWSVDMPAADLPSGETTMDVTATATDAAGNTASATTTVAVDTETSVTLDLSGAGADGIINAAEAAAGVTLSGNAEAGASVEVTANGNVYTVTADPSGTWSVDMPQADLPSGVTTMDVTATATDAAGNSATVTSQVGVDTDMALTIDTSTLASDGTVNAAEHAGMVTFTGTGEAGAAVSMTLAGVTVTGTVAADGTWALPFSASVLPTDDGSGQTVLTATVTSQDAAGNTSTASGDFTVDVLNAVSIDTGIEGDDIVNAAERADGVELTGMGEPGAAVTVTVNGADHAATVAADGSWSVMLPANLIPEGETTLPITATSVDAAGNTASASGMLEIDTVTNVAVVTDGVETDGIVNAAEHADGVTLTGTAEAGATVDVTLGAVTRAATVAADGSWSADFTAAEIPVGETTLRVTAVATDPAGNSATATGDIDVDTLVRNFAVTSTPGGADGVVNADEAALGLTLSGTSEPGGTVTLTLAGEVVTAQVDAAGNWSASFAASQLPSGEAAHTLTAVATDLAGNSTTTTQSISFDTDAGLLTIDPDPVETDDIVNFVEASDGVVLTGTSNPGQMVEVSMNGVSMMVLTDAAGNWSAPFAASEIAPGTYTADIIATITDSAGNMLTRTDSVEVDTEVLNFAHSGTPVEGDNVINANEASDGFTLSGTTELGSAVDVSFEGINKAATVDAAGNWTVTFQAGEIPAGESLSNAVINATDLAGNTAQTQVDFAIDTEVNTLNTTGGPVTGDGVVNAAEAAAGFSLTGMVEVGSSVEVTFGGVAHVATVAADGSWSVDIPAGSIPAGTLAANAVIEATDAAGNTRTITETISIDTEAPDTLGWTGYGRDGSGIDLIRTEMTDDTVFIGQLDDPSGTPSVNAVAIESETDIGAIGQTYYTLDGAVPDGTHLVLGSTDAAGNSSGALLVTDDPATNTVQMSDDIAQALSGFQIDTIDLHFAEDSELTITESQIEALSSTTDTVSIRGGADDSVTITGASAQGTQVEDGVTYNVFSLGDASLLIEDDIAVHGVT